jgi:hypothetical protein
MAKEGNCGKRAEKAIKAKKNMKNDLADKANGTHT